MSEIKFYELKCPICGGKLNRHSEDIYRCNICSKTFCLQMSDDLADWLDIEDKNIGCKQIFYEEHEMFEKIGESNPKYCKRCRTENKPSAKFCSNCGSNDFFNSYGEYLDSNFKYCSNCGTQSGYADKYCIECGATKFVTTKKDYEILAAKREEKQKKKISKEEKKRSFEKLNGKKLFCIIICIILVVFCICGACVGVLVSKSKIAQITQNDMVFEKNGVGYTLTKYTGNNTSLTIPSIINDYAVTAIGEYAFYRNTNIINVEIPDTVITIGADAFLNCASLESISIGKGVKYIGGSAFFGCEALKYVYITDLTAWNEISFATSAANPLYYANNLYLNGVLQ